MIEPLPRILVSELCKFVMAILNILRYPDERLHKIATEVPSITREIRTLVSDMAETMYAAPGIGLAATQVDVHQRIIVIDVSETRDELLVLINPEIISSSGNAETQEGCLSVPGILTRSPVPRKLPSGQPALMENPLKWTHPGCWQFVSSTKWIISWEKYLSNTCHPSSNPAF